ncbi:MAG: alpha/beta hydrolase [Actinomycetales bacterium]|nr:alpha/beta hydrolase [Actinomycetales bacterium]
MTNAQGQIRRDGVEIHYEVHGSADGQPTILLLPTWTIVHSRFWKLQTRYLARHHRVVTYDGPGNGGSSRPTSPTAYGHDRQVGYALDVLDATGTERAVVVALSKGALWALQLAAEHGDRVLGSVLIGASVPLTDGHAQRAAKGDAFALPPSVVPLIARDPMEHWAKYDPGYWAEHYEDFLWFFFGMCFPEGHSTKPIEDCVRWGLETTAEVLAADAAAPGPARETVEGWCAAIASPVVTIHGDRDLISPLSRAERIAELTGGRCVVIRGGGHIPLARDPVRVNLLLHELAQAWRADTVCP